MQTQTVSISAFAIRSLGLITFRFFPGNIEQRNNKNLQGGPYNIVQGIERWVGLIIEVVRAGVTLGLKLSRF